MSVCIIGSGLSGLITGHTLLSDGFDVQIITRDQSPGGIWSPERVYPDLSINNVHGEFRFSCLDMPKSANAGGRLSGEDMQNYAASFTSRFLSGRILYRKEVTRIRRAAVGQWEICVRDLDTGTESILQYNKLVLCTGGCSQACYPEKLSPSMASEAGFNGLVFHSSKFRSHLEDILSRTTPKDGELPKKIVIIGGGKSAQDIARYLALRGRAVSVVFKKTDAVLATPFVLPKFVRRSRFFGILSPHIILRTKLERFLHKTTVGPMICHGVCDLVSWVAYKSLAVPSSSPLRNAHPIFWGVRINDEGRPNKNGFHALVKRGKIELIAPARADHFSDDGKGIVLEDGRYLEAEVVVLATGYTSSWKPLFDDRTREEIGLFREAAETGPHTNNYTNMWNYKSIRNPPKGSVSSQQPWISPVYRGLVPAKSILNHDFAINGAVFTINNGYTYEVSAHWISSYFLRDSFLRLPSSVEEALAHAEMSSAWLHQRYPTMLSWVNESYSTGIAFLHWPQAMDDLLEDMSVLIHRSGGNWLTWVFKPIELKEIAMLGEERRALRSSSVS